MSETANMPAVDIAFRTDPGRDPDKQVNEDSAVHVETPLGLLAIVCDGMGGHAGGKEASELAVKTIVELVQGAPPVTKPRDALRVAIEEANRRIWTMPTIEAGYRPGSTVVAILAHAAGAEIAHVGDSRIYFVHAGAISQITRDHSMVQEMVDRNLIRAEDAATHPDANKILRALGIAKEVEVEVRPEPLPYVAGDVFVLCSDGLSDLVGPGEILEVAGSKPANQAAGQLVELANARGGHDNITTMCVRMKGSATPGDAPTIVKTVQLTVDGLASAQNAEAPSGPRGTVLAMPAQPLQVPPNGGAGGTHVARPLGGAGPGAPAVIPPHSPSSIHGNGGHADHGEHAERRSPLPLIIGIGLAVVALAIGAVLLWTMQRPRHVTAHPVDDPPRVADAAATDESAEVAPVVTDTPPLVPAPSSKSEWWKDPDASPPSGEPRACVQARWAKRTAKPAAMVADLEKRCRAAGGQP